MPLSHCVCSRTSHVAVYIVARNALLYVLQYPTEDPVAAYCTALARQFPTQRHRKPAATLPPMYRPVNAMLPSLPSNILSFTKVENVVKPPQNPVVSSSFVSCICPRSEGPRKNLSAGILRYLQQTCAAETIRPHPPATISIPQNGHHRPESCPYPQSENL